MDYLILILVISISLQFTAAFFALRLIKITDKPIAWALLSSAIFLMVIRRCFMFFSVISGELSRQPDLISESIALITSAFMLAAIFYIGTLFLSIKRSENSLHIANRAYKVLSNCNQAVVHSADESKLLHEICRIIVEDGGYRLAWIGFAEQDKLKTIRPVAQIGFEEGYLETVNITWADAKRGKGPTGTAIRTGKPSIAQNILTDPAYEPWRDQAIKRGYASAIALPLFDNSHSFGALNVYAAEPEAFAAEEVNLLNELAGDLAYGIMTLRTRDHRQRAEETLREREEQYKNLYSMMRLMCDNLPDLIWTKDIEGNFLFVNKACSEILLDARDTDEPIGKTDIYFANRMIKSHPEIPDYLSFGKKCVESDLTVLKTKKPMRFDESGNVKGNFLFLDVYKAPFEDENRNIIGTVGCARIVTKERQMEKEHKRAEEQIRLANERLQYLIFSSAAVIYTSMPSPDYEITFISENILKMTGYLSNVFLDNSGFWFKQIHPEDRQRILNELPRIFEQEIYTLEYRFRRKDGTYIWVHDDKKLVLDMENKPLEVISYVLDVTERKKVEEQLLGAQKMEAVGKLAGGVAHDFNNLLTVINGYSEIILTQSLDKESARKHIEQIKKAGERAASLTTQLLIFSRRQIIQPKIINLNSVVSDVEKMLQRLIGEDIELVTMLDKESGNIKADPSQIDQVIMNLAVNARDAMPKGGKLIIETKKVYLDKDYAKRHLSVKPGAYIMLAISDTGVGMDAETKSKIFEPFFTTKERGKGTGLGLSTVYGIVKQSGGNIWVYSEPGKGTTFKIYLARIEEETDKEVKAKSSPESLKGSETILLVEDDHGVRKLARDILTNYGYHVLDAENGDRAISICNQYKKAINLMITDVVMPKMSGRELEKKITPLYPEIKVLFVSGYTDNAIVHHGVLDSDVAFLAKPFGTDSLVHKVREVLDTS
jgi:PAS domain S-box-containing protein